MSNICPQRGVGGEFWPPHHKDAPFLIPEPETVTLHDKGDFATVIKLRIWRWGGYPRAARWARRKDRGPRKREAGGSDSEKATWHRRRDRSGGTSEELGLQRLALREGEGVQGSRNARGSSSWKGQERSPSQKECSRPRLDFSPGEPFRRLASGSARR